MVILGDGALSAKSMDRLPNMSAGPGRHPARRRLERAQLSIKAQEISS
jgi:hypothetical protein